MPRSQREMVTQDVPRMWAICSWVKSKDLRISLIVTVSVASIYSIFSSRILRIAVCLSILSRNKTIFIPCGSLAEVTISA